MWQSSKTLNVTKLKDLKCDKNENVTELKISKSDKTKKYDKTKKNWKGDQTQNWKCDITQKMKMGRNLKCDKNQNVVKLKLWHNSNLTKFKISNCDKKKLELSKLFFLLLISWHNLSLFVVIFSVWVLSQFEFASCHKWSCHN